MPETWSRVTEILALALEQSPGERDAFIRRACGNDHTLRAEVESLLSNYDAADSLLEHSPVCDVLSFQPDAMTGQKIGAYRLIRELGHGGMAVVYLGERDDHNFRKRVAIKMLKPRTNTVEILSRFQNERQTLAALDHPQIVKLLDGGSTEEGLPYLVMDYVEGLPIDQYCDLHKLSIHDRLRLFRDVCAAVQYAHQNLVIHRDLKPGNILITKDRVPRLLDFGIAKLLNPECFHVALVTQTDWRPMTPEYASPEQLRGDAVTRATDIYSLGVMLYELLTGRRPHSVGSHSRVEIELRVCKEEPKKPSAVVKAVGEDPSHEGKTRTVITPELVSRNRGLEPAELGHQLRGDLDTIVMKALRIEPEDRYASVEDFSNDIGRHLAGMPVNARKPTISYRSGRFLRRHKESVVTAMIVLTAMVGLGIWEARSRWRQNSTEQQQSSAVPFHTRPSVAVLGFKNLSSRQDTAWLSTALSEMLSTQLAAGEKLRTIPGEDVARTKIDLSLPDTDSLGKDTLARLRKNLGSDFVVLGSYLDLGKEAGGQIRLDLRLQDAVAGETLASVSEKGSETQLDEMIGRAGADLRAKLGVGDLSEAQSAAVKAALPTNPEAARMYAEGLTKLRAFDSTGARDLLQKAIVAEPNFALAHSALAAAWQSLGYDAKAREQAQKAFDVSAHLSREDQLSVEGKFRETAHDWDRAVEAYRTLFGFYADNLDYGLRLAEAQTNAGGGKAALITIEALRKLGSPMRDDPRIDLAAADAADLLGDFKQELSTVGKAIEKARAQGARLVMARALTMAGWASYNLGQPKEAIAYGREARGIYDTAGDRMGVVWSVRIIGSVLRDQGDLVGAKRTFEETFKISQELGNKRGMAGALSDLGMVLDLQGDLVVAKKKYEESLAVSRETNNKDDTARTLNNIAILLMELGDLAGASKAWEESLTIFREAGDKGGTERTMSSIAELLMDQGDLLGAQKLYDQALKISGEIGDKSGSASTLLGRGKVFAIEGNFSKARKEYEQALAMRNEIGEKGAVAEAMVTLAELEIEEGRPVNAEAPVRQAREEFRGSKQIDDEITADTVLARSLLARGKSADALKEIDAAKAILGNSQNRAVRLDSAIVAARVLAASNQPSEAKIRLEAALSEATKTGFVPERLEARLALGEIEMKSHQTSAGRARLQALERDANAKGFLLIARKAAAAARISVALGGAQPPSASFETLTFAT
jgi:serine/threonine protein kinase/tetratricopeptide (TPR) repeat protein